MPLFPILADCFATDFANETNPLTVLNISFSGLTIPVIPVKNLPNCTILDSWVFEKIILTDEPYAKALRFF